MTMDVTMRNDNLQIRDTQYSNITIISLIILRSCMLYSTYHHKISLVKSFELAQETMFSFFLIQKSQMRLLPLHRLNQH